MVCWAPRERHVVAWYQGLFRRQETMVERWILSHGGWPEKDGSPVISVFGELAQQSVSWRSESVICGPVSKVQEARRKLWDSLPRLWHQCYNLKCGPRKTDSRCHHATGLTWRVFYWGKGWEKREGRQRLVSEYRSIGERGRERGGRLNLSLRCRCSTCTQRSNSQDPE